MKTHFGVCGLMLFLCVCRLRSDVQDDLSMRTLSAAIDAHGGKRALAQIENSWARAKGTLFLDGVAAAEISGESWYAQPDKRKQITRGASGNRSFQRIDCVNGEKGWERLEGAPQRPLTMESIRATQELLLHNRARRLFRLAEDPDFSVKFSREVVVKGKVTVALEISHRRWSSPATYYFDKATHLLSKVAYVEITGESKTRLIEEYCSEYRKIGEAVVSTRAVVHFDGEKYSDTRLLEVRPLKEEEVKDPKTWLP